MTLCIIIPCLNEGAALLTKLQALQSLRSRGVQVVVVVDGGSADATLVGAAALADQVLTAPRGRASQMNAGACTAVATRADALLFLHAEKLRRWVKSFSFGG